MFAALTVLVMGYPCAVGISAPLSIVRGASEAADKGVLMRTGEAFQALRKVNKVVFDKTGTLALGDAPARMQADVGIAMGGGTDIATAIFINSLWQRPALFFDTVASVGD